MPVRLSRSCMALVGLSVLGASSTSCGLDRASIGPGETIIEPSDGLDAGDVAPIAPRDAGTTTPPLSADAAGMSVLRDADTASTSCELEGRYALRIEAQVRWAGTTLFEIVPIITPGAGTVTIDVAVDMESGTGMRAGSIQACGASVPDFSSSVFETYGVVIPNEVWGKVDVGWDTRISSSCEQPGCLLEATGVTAQLGIDIAESAVWPGPRDDLDVSSLRDEDGDDVPGILLRCRGPKDPGAVSYMHPPTTPLLSPRASEIMLALRIAAQLSGKLDSCDAFSGSVPGMSIDTRALACRLDSGARCDDSQLGFVDDNLPVWKVDSATFRAVRLKKKADCADVRNAFR